MNVHCDECGLSDEVVCDGCGAAFLDRSGMIDPRWRPMRTAPKDGTVVEALHGQHTTLAYFQRDHWRETSGTENLWEIHNPRAWRPAHPEWNQDES